eukprot:Pompholyxophrys_punicea_v1_NODE_318_length_2275_cov_16.666216.p2 type:complete len:138 gc:universal NODE_318_length_2275_cov_16.666216:1727-1314(-)
MSIIKLAFNHRLNLSCAHSIFVAEIQNFKSSAYNFSTTPPFQEEGTCCGKDGRRTIQLALEIFVCILNRSGQNPTVSRLQESRRTFCFCRQCCHSASKQCNLKAVANPFHVHCGSMSRSIDVSFSTTLFSDSMDGIA